MNEVAVHFLAGCVWKSNGKWWELAGHHRNISPRGSLGTAVGAAQGSDDHVWSVHFPEDSVTPFRNGYGTFLECLDAVEDVLEQWATDNLDLRENPDGGMILVHKTEEA